ncbi:MAG: DedA family protein [Eubacteriales bacterium]|nr:DedA family protein [Eubacteriales bacterium]
MLTWITTTLSRFGYPGLTLLIALENLFPPIPSEVILTFAGFLTTCTSLNVWLSILCATLGSLLGAIILYYLGQLLTPAQLKALLSGKAGRLLRLRPTDVDTAIGWFEKKGCAAVFLCRFIPMIRSLISIPAGITKMKLLPFLVLTTLGSAIWNTVLIWLGAFAGASWQIIVSYLDTYSSIALIALLTAAILFLAAIFRKRRQASS